MDIIDELIRSSRRKTLSITIDCNARVLARAPQNMSNETIYKFAESKRSWITRKKAELLRKKQSQPEIKFSENEEFFFRGQKYPLKFIPENDSPALIYFDNAFIISKKYKSKARTLLIGWYEIKAEQFIAERVKNYAEAFNISYRKIRVVNTKSQWGSCSTTGNLSFCWKLIMCPTRIIDYVVAHELAHRIEMNHSKRFWSLVERMRPDYQESRKWLKSNSHLLNI